MAVRSQDMVRKCRLVPKTLPVDGCQCQSRIHIELPKLDDLLLWLRCSDVIDRKPLAASLQGTHILALKADKNHMMHLRFIMVETEAMLWIWALVFFFAFSTESAVLRAIETAVVVCQFFLECLVVFYCEVLARLQPIEIS